MKDFEQGNRVTVNDTLSLLKGQEGTVTNPDYMGYIMVSMDNETLVGALGCFLAEELNDSNSQDCN